MLHITNTVPMLIAPTRGPRPPAPDDAAVRAELAELVARAGELDPGDETGSSLLRARAGRLTARLIRAGRLPAHLGVDARDPIVAVQRTLAVVARIIGSADRVAPRGGS